MRILLLRALIAWWLIPVAAFIFLPIVALLAGWKAGMADYREFCHDLWYGVE